MTIEDLAEFIIYTKSTSYGHKYQPYVQSAMEMNLHYCSKYDDNEKYLDCMFELTNTVMENIKMYNNINKTFI